MIRLLHLGTTILLLAALCGCDRVSTESKPVRFEPVEMRTETPTKSNEEPTKLVPSPKRERPFKVVHVFVPLCDNRHQGIVKVPEALGNGQEPRGNLYWGAMYGADTFFARSEHWKRMKQFAPPAVDGVLAWSVFRGRPGGPDVLVVMCAYDGRRMKQTLLDFLNAAAGANVTEIEVTLDGQVQRVQIGGRADLVCFAGHNGLMDVRLDAVPQQASEANPDGAVVLACKSHAYFVAPLRAAGCEPVITTSGLMAPEAYTLDAIIRSWAAGDGLPAIHRSAAAAYAKYQKCGTRAAQRLFVAGWGESPPGPHGNRPRKRSRISENS